MCNFASSTNDPQYEKLKELIQPLLASVANNKRGAKKKAVGILFMLTAEIPRSFFDEKKDPEYPQRVLSAIKQYINCGKLKRIRTVARKRRTDRLVLTHAIAFDVLEYLAFLPMKFSCRNPDTQRYLENLDNALWLLHKKSGVNEDFFAKIELQLQ